MGRESPKDWVAASHRQPLNIRMTATAILDSIQGAEMSYLSRRLGLGTPFASRVSPTFQHASTIPGSHPVAAISQGHPGETTAVLGASRPHQAPMHLSPCLRISKPLSVSQFKLETSGPQHEHFGAHGMYMTVENPAKHARSC